ncbi:MAG TPA: secretin N-terminal domain-containing protein [Planctomycetota bacterium]|nr:secretin N-terminal domain-containing protein [Planctomycetota bacterium]
MKFTALALILSLSSCCAFRPHGPTDSVRAPGSAEQSGVDHKVIPLRFAAADDLARILLGSVQGQHGRPDPHIIPDERTNSLIVTCAPGDLAAIEKLIADLDTQVPKQ